jgi:two-component system, NtrC family, sensor kinase
MAERADPGTTDAAASRELVAFFRLSGDLLAVADQGLRLTHLNPSWEAQLGHRALVGRSILEVVAPRDREKVRQTLNASLVSGASRSFDAALVRRSQQLRHGHWTVSSDRDEKKLYLVVRDMTVRQRLERELSAAHKLEAIGQLAAGVAHEINTPVQFIGDNLTFLQDSFAALAELFARLKAHPEDGAPPDAEGWKAILAAMDAADLDFVAAEAPRALASAAEGVERVAELVRGLKEFAHPDAQVMSPADLNRAIERTLTVSRNEWKYVAEVETVLEPLPEVTCQVSAVNQVLLNLICNAAHAIEDKLKPRAPSKAGGGPVVKEKGKIRIATQSDGQVVTISVSDTGVGIPEGVRDRIFEPFFTTKEVGRGSGQGLAISRSIIVEKHHGTLDFESKVGVGTTFRIRLPVEPEAQERDA